MFCTLSWNPWQAKVDDLPEWKKGPQWKKLIVKLPNGTQVRLGVFVKKWKKYHSVRIPILSLFSLRGGPCYNTSRMLGLPISRYMQTLIWGCKVDSPTIPDRLQHICIHLPHTEMSEKCVLLPILKHMKSWIGTSENHPMQENDGKLTHFPKPNKTYENRHIRCSPHFSHRSSLQFVPRSPMQLAKGSRLFRATFLAHWGLLKIPWWRCNML